MFVFFGDMAADVLTACIGTRHVSSRWIMTRRWLTPNSPLSSTRQRHDFDIPVPESTASRERHPDKARLRTRVLALRAAGHSYRAIGQQLGLHHSRVWQIVKSAADDN